MEHIEIAVKWAHSNHFKFGEPPGSGIAVGYKFQELGLAVMVVPSRGPLRPTQERRLTRAYRSWSIPSKFAEQPTKALRYILEESGGWDANPGCLVFPSAE